MHPSGIQFGLSRGLLQLRGEEVLLSDQLLEAISLEARREPIDQITTKIAERCK